MVWFFALRHGDAKQDPVVYDAEYRVVFLAKGLRTASIQEGFYCLGLTIRVLREGAAFGWL